MALKTKTDYYGIATTGLEVSDTSENRSISTAEAQGEDGFVVATESFGEKVAPTVNYVVTGTSVTLSDVVLGERIAFGTGQNAHKLMLATITISTSAGNAPTVSATGQQVEDGDGIDNCTVTLDDVTISGLHHAQFFGGITMSGTGAHLTSSTYTLECTISTADVDGVTKASDLTGGKRTFTGNITVSGSTYAVPTITLPSGWHFTTPVTETNPNGDFPTYTFTAEAPLAADAA